MEQLSMELPPSKSATVHYSKTVAGESSGIFGISYLTGKSFGNSLYMFMVREDDCIDFAYWLRDYKASLIKERQGEIWAVTKYPRLHLDRVGDKWVLQTTRGIVLYEKETLFTAEQLREMVEDHNDLHADDDYNFLTTVNMQYIF